MKLLIMEKGIYLIKNPEEFLQVMEKLQEEYLASTSTEGRRINSNGVERNE